MTWRVVLTEGWMYVAAVSLLVNLVLVWMLVAGQSAAHSALIADNAYLHTRLNIPTAIPTPVPTPRGSK